uniref:Alternative protein ATP5H n=1 Tax=Homo sapiens TaxID=9606 RepID=L8E9E1_HUMAN|nr:alternative protein ATP5H [Homo sapiens]
MRPSPPGWLLYLRIHQLSTGLTTRPMWPRLAWWMTLRRSLMR